MYNTISERWRKNINFGQKVLSHFHLIFIHLFSKFWTTRILYKKEDNVL